MAESLHSRRTRILGYFAIGIGLAAFVFYCALPILLGSMGMDILLTKSYFVVAHFHWLKLLCVVIGIAAVITLARSLYARFIGS
jgi:heme/copper-type cytochrome/quinol oxidase subunit 1